MQPPYHSLPDSLKQQLGLIDNSLDYILLIIVALLLSYSSVSVQKRQLLCSLQPGEPCCQNLPDVFALQSSSSLLVLISSIYFFNLAEDGCCQVTADPCVKKRNSINHDASLLVLLAAGMRFTSLMEQGPAGQGNGMEELESSVPDI